MRETDVPDTKGILRPIQSVPSHKAEPLKMWLAGIAKVEFEKRTGKEAVSAINAKNKNDLEIKEKSEDK